MVEGKGIQGWDFSVRHAEIFEHLCRSVPKSSEHLQGCDVSLGPDGYHGCLSEAQTRPWTSLENLLLLLELS